MEIYSVESRKGGVGKTTIALNLAKALAKKKYDVLLIDCDVTGTPITKAAWHSPFWRDHVIAAFKDHPDMDKTPFNLLDYYKNVFLKGKDSEKNSILKHETIIGKIHLIGSDIYDEKGKIIIDPRDLMDDLHSYWFLDMIKEIARNYFNDSSLPKRAIVLDNSPGFVGIGKSVRDWLTGGEVEKARFVLVSSLDEQDIASTLNSAKDIQSILPNNARIENYVRVVINKVPQDLLEEGNGYKILPDGNEQSRELVNSLFPLDMKKYPKNIVKYDKLISGQFVEASLLPYAKDDQKGRDLGSAFRRVEKRLYLLKESRKPYYDINFLSSSYHILLRKLNGNGYVRMSQILASEEFLPETIVKQMSDQIGRLGSMAFTNTSVLQFSKQDIKRIEVREMERFIRKNQLEEYYPLFKSLLQGLLKKAGIDRKDTNIFQLVNLVVMLRAFYVVHDKFFEKGSDYRKYLKGIKKSVKKFKLKECECVLHYPGLQNEDFYDYSQSLLNAFFKDFFRTICYTLLRMIDCEKDYSLIIDACKETIDHDVKMMSESLVTHLKRIVYRKNEEQDQTRYQQLLRDPFEMKAVQRLIMKHVLD